MLGSKQPWWRPLAACALIAGVGGCGADDAGDGLSGLNAGAGGAGSDGGGTGGNAGGNTGALPPEEEVELSFERPAVGRRRIYALNPATDRVAVIDAQTFAIESIEVGNQPDFAVTVPGRDVAAVLNVGSRSVSVLRTEGGATASVEIPIGIEANRLEMAPGGGHVLAYFDGAMASSSASSFQDVSVVSLQGEESAARVTVGFRPSSVQFAEDGSTAFVVTEDGISVIDLREASEADGTIARLVSVGDAVTEAVSNDLSVTPDGRYALARRDGSSVLRLVDLDSGDIAEVDVAELRPAEPVDSDAGLDAGADAGDAGGEAGDGGGDAETPAAPSVDLTDADLAPDGSFVLAVVRSEGAVVKLPVPGAFEGTEEAAWIPLQDAPLIGSAELSRDGTLAVLYTTASLDVESVTLLELTGDEPAQHSVRLRKAVRAVALSDDASRLLVLHRARSDSQAAPGASEEDTRIDRSEGYSVVDVPSRFAKLQLTDALVSSVGGFVITPEAEHLFVIVRNDSEGVSALQQVDLSSLAVRSIELAAPPATLGVVPEVERAFVGQEMPGGMLTFVHWPDGEVQTVTGFELSSRIRQ